MPTVSIATDVFTLFRRKQRHETLLPYYFFMPAFILVAAISFLPLGYAVVQSLFRSDYLELGKFVGLGNYYDYLVGQDGLWSVWNSLVYVLASVAIAVPFGFACGLVLNRPIPFRGLLRTVLILPWLVSNLVCGLMWLWLVNPQFGIAGYVFRQLSLALPNMVTNPVAAMAAVVVATGWAQYPLVMVFMLAALQTVPQELVEAAQIDGASTWQRFRHITVPMVRNTLMLALILSSLHCFKNVEIILVMTGGGPNGATETMALRVFLEGFRFFRMGIGSAGAVMIFLLNLMFTFAFMRVLRSEHGA
jgi:ABC-type sugar transport system permease subunit